MPTQEAPLRLFFAAPVSDAVREGARAAIASLRRSGADVRWVEPETLHLTLRFLGSTPPEKVPGLERALAAAVSGKSAFEVSFDRIGSFEERGLPRVIWAGVSSGGAELAALAAALSGALEAEGLEPERREFKAHLTLGRLRSPRGASYLRKALSEAEPLDWSCRIDRLVLYKSELGKDGARHDELAQGRLV